MKKYVSIDVGGTAIKYACINENAEILEKGEIPTSVKNLEEYTDVLADISCRFDDIEAVVMSAPGKIDADTGYFHTGGALRFMEEKNLKEAFQKKRNIPFKVENDAKCAAFAEMWKGSMQGIRSGAVMTLGTGIGGAIILNGDIYTGAHLSAGEFSTIPLHWDRKYDRHQCWYNQQGVGYLSERYAEKINVDPKQMNGRILFQDIENGSATAKETLKEYCDSLASGIFGLQAILDLEKYAIGGGISRQSLLIEMLNQSMDEVFQEAHGFPEERPQIVPCTFTSDANMIGALYAYLKTKD